MNRSTFLRRAFGAAIAAPALTAIIAKGGVDSNENQFLDFNLKSIEPICEGFASLKTVVNTEDVKRAYDEVSGPNSKYPYLILHSSFAFSGAGDQKIKNETSDKFVVDLFNGTYCGDEELKVFIGSGAELVLEQLLLENIKMLSQMEAIDKYGNCFSREASNYREQRTVELAKRFNIVYSPSVWKEDQEVYKGEFIDEGTDAD